VAEEVTEVATEETAQVLEESGVSEDEQDNVEEVVEALLEDGVVTVQE